MDFATIKDAALLVLMFVVFGVPALALAARLAIRPVLDAVLSLREIAAGHSVRPDPRLAELEAEVSRLGVEVGRLAEAEAFHRRLIEAAAPESFPASGESIARLSR